MVVYDTKSGPNVVCLISDELLSFEFGIAYEVFGLPRSEFGDDWYRFSSVAVTPGFIKSSGGLPVFVQDGLEALEKADLIVVPGWPNLTAPVSQAVIDALRDAHGRGARIASLCSGAAVLAAAGLLDDRIATTHWRFAEELSRTYPEITFDPDVLYTDDGDVMTAAGSAAGMDLCIHIVRQDYGMEHANIIAQGLVMPTHRDGGESQIIPMPVARTRESSRLGHLIDALRKDLARGHALSDLAAEVGMSVRTFQRRFEAMTGLPPSTWIMNERLRAACNLLENSTELQLEVIAEKCGFGSLPAMRHHFRKKLGLSPREYRRRTVARSNIALSYAIDPVSNDHDMALP
ncbi:transcriptional regulator FtrA [Salinicola sp. CPA57]|uniref:transcriptional regulator FtrA n=1 Tax=Salinicola sp. CPA57 TaxID=1949080 RepID=UPI000DA19041|nr:transcriptional regulator FtrA [Salinicola sp. CPA57]